MPSMEKCKRNAKYIWNLFKIPNICMGMDGCHAIFEDQCSILSISTVWGGGR